MKRIIKVPVGTAVPDSAVLIKIEAQEVNNCVHGYYGSSGQVEFAYYEAPVEEQKEELPRHHQMAGSSGAVD